MSGYQQMQQKYRSRQEREPITGVVTPPVPSSITGERAKLGHPEIDTPELQERRLRAGLSAIPETRYCW